LRAQDGFRRITAPFDGVVTERNTNIGAPVNADCGSGNRSAPVLFRIADIQLTPNGENLSVVATNGLYEGYDTYGGYPQDDLVTIHKLGPNGAYGWVAKLSEGHSGYDVRWVQVYGVIGRSVTLLTTVITYFESNEASGCGTEGQERCSTLSVKYAFQTQSSASLFYPIILRASGISHGRRFRGNYRLVFDKSSLTYLAPKNMLDEIKPFAFKKCPSAAIARS
jgi:hypothetical protein